MYSLVVNAGSVTTKYKLFDANLEQVLYGQLDNKNGKYFSELYKNSERHTWEITALEFENAAKLIVQETKDYQIAKVGFRIVHGGEEFTAPTLLDDATLAKLDKISKLAPLHNPHTLAKIRQFKELLPGTPLFGVFDTAFHAQMPQYAFMYGLPFEYYSHYGIRKYGFHGISHKYLSSLLKELEPSVSKVITCHLGGGASLTAIRDGVSIDTSMGFTPMEGLMMATRAGDVDDGAIKFLQDVTRFNDHQIDEIENKKSGLLGISGYTSDMRRLLEDSAAGKDRAKLAIEMYVYRIKKYFGAFVAALGGIDAVAVTGGVGAGSDVIRKAIFSGFECYGLKLDDSINNGRINVAESLKISTAKSKPIWVIPANEELQIAREIS